MSFGIESGTARHRILTLSLIALVPSAILAQDAVAFRAELDAVRKLVLGTDWAAATAGLSQLLTRHAGQPYAVGTRTEIIELHRQCEFESAYRRPELDRLVSAKVLSYNPRTHRIKLLYTPQTLGDFADPNRPKPKPKKRPVRRPGQLPQLVMPKPPKTGPDYRPRIHSAVFRSYKLTIEGSSYRSTTLLTGLNADGRLQIAAGAPRITSGLATGYIPTRIIRHQGSAKSELFQETWQPRVVRQPKRSNRRPKPKKSRWPMASGGRYKIELEVNPTGLRLRINGKLIAKPRWTGEVVGTFGFDDPRFTELTVSGKVEPAWVQGLFDAHRHTARQEFARSYRPGARLPAWLFRAPAISNAPRQPTEQRAYPGTGQPADMEFLATCLQLLRERSGRTVLLRLSFAKRGRLPEIVTTYLRAYAHLVIGSYERAIEFGKSVVAADPGFSNGRSVLGQAYLGLRRGAEAEVQFRAVVAQRPDSASGHYHLAAALLQQQKMNAVLVALGAAATAGVTHERLDQMRRRVAKTIHGPSFSKRFMVQTRHYEIISDIDEKSCRDAGKVLERAFAYYRTLVGKVAQDQASAKRFRVFLFAGRQGYLAYLVGIDIKTPIHTSGLYVPELGQLLIWNLPTRNEMLRTIRHEGFHQFFDLLVTDAPVWLNEGLAEYFEAATGTGKPVPGRIQPRHLRSLALVRPSARGSLATFLRGSRDSFYKKAATNYAQGWALVHFLRRGKPEVRAIFDTLLAALVAGKSSEQALDQALQGVDIDVLSAGFWDYVDDLQERR